MVWIKFPFGSIYPRFLNSHAYTDGESVAPIGILHV